jgi:predicted nuclease with TOPRIM domain
MGRLVFPLILVVGLAIAASAQTPDAAAIKGTQAYAEVLLRKTELLADLEAFSPDYTEANPRMLELRAELSSIEKSLTRILAVKPSEAGRLTEALGRMMVKKAGLEADLQHLSRQYNKDYPDVKRAQRRVDLYESAISDILK